MLRGSERLDASGFCDGSGPLSLFWHGFARLFWRGLHFKTCLFQSTGVRPILVAFDPRVSRSLDDSSFPRLELAVRAIARFGQAGQVSQAPVVS